MNICSYLSSICALSFILSSHIPYIPSDLHFILILPSLTIHYHSTITYSAQGHLSRTADIATSDPRTWDFEKLTTNFTEKQIAEATLPLNPKTQGSLISFSITKKLLMYQIHRGIARYHDWESIEIIGSWVHVIHVSHNPICSFKLALESYLKHIFSPKD